MRVHRVRIHVHSYFWLIFQKIYEKRVFVLRFSVTRLAFCVCHKKTIFSTCVVLDIFISICAKLVQNPNPSILLQGWIRKERNVALIFVKLYFLFKKFIKFASLIEIFFLILFINKRMLFWFFTSDFLKTKAKFINLKNSHTWVSPNVAKIYLL